MAKGGSSFDRDCICPKRTRKAKSHPQKVDGLVNARLMAFEHPETFKTPTDAQIKKLKPGDFVKVARNDERFWVRVDGYIGRRWHGTIDNELQNDHNPDLKIGDSIFFMRKNIYDLMYK